MGSLKPVSPEIADEIRKKYPLLFLQMNEPQSKFIRVKTSEDRTPRTRVAEMGNKCGKTHIGIGEDIAHMQGFRPWLKKDDPDYKIEIKVPNVGLVIGETVMHSIAEKIVPTFKELIPDYCKPIFKAGPTGVPGHCDGLSDRDRPCPLSGGDALDDGGVRNRRRRGDGHYRSSVGGARRRGEGPEREVAAVIVHAQQTHYDATMDVLYLVAAGGPIHRSTEVAPGITIEYGKDGEIIGLEILRASQVLAEKVVASLHAKQAGVL